MPSLVVTLLAERSPAELAGLRDKMQTELNRLSVELEQVEAALVLQARTAKPQPVGGGRRVGSSAIRKRVLEIVGASPEPISPAEIRSALAEQGGAQPAANSIYSIVKRLSAQGALRKVADGQYTLPTPNGNAVHGPTENGSGQPLSMAVPPQEAT